MNIEQEQRLEKIFKENGNKGIAIAITGCWGIGKTFAWNKFLEKHAKEEESLIKHWPAYKRNEDYRLFSKKYSYVSLFGVENLSDLKAAISTNMSSNCFNHESSKNFEIPSFIKKGLSALREVKLTSSEYGISSSARIFESMLYAQVRNAIICFDDFERMSNKLDIKDVMGLANQLKLERNCQVILILDESKNEDENKKKYADYKEKLIDETIKVNSVEPLIRANTEDIDERLVDLMVEFADELGIHNFRFFQKVIKLYVQFLRQLPEVVAYSTKEIILLRIMQGYFIEDYGIECEYSWENAKYVAEQERKSWSEKKAITYEKLEGFSYSFIHSDEWSFEFKKWFEQSNDLDFSVLTSLANSELISQKINLIKEEFNQLLKSFWGLKVDESFPDRLYESTKNVIGLENLSNISFAIYLIEQTEPSKKIEQLELLTINWIKEKLKENRRAFYNVESWGNIREIFKSSIENFKNNSENLPNLIDAVFKKYIHGAWSHEDDLALEKASKDKWKELIFTEISQDERFSNSSTSQIVKKILDDSSNSEFKKLFRQKVIDIYQEKGKESEFYRNYMNYLISRLDN